MEYRVDGTDLTAVANAIRTKGGTSAGLSFPDGFVSAVQNIPSGGSSVPVVVGTFTGGSAEEGSAKAITVPYTGNGYPIAGIFYPTAGSFKAGTTVETLASQYACIMFAFAKNDVRTEPVYTSNVGASQAEIVNEYKGSNSDANSTSVSRTHNRRFYNSGTNASAYADSIVIVKSSTSLSVYIRDTGNGFIPEVEYTYVLLYSE